MPSYVAKSPTIAALQMTQSTIDNPGSWPAWLTAALSAGRVVTRAGVVTVERNGKVTPVPVGSYITMNPSGRIGVEDQTLFEATHKLEV